MVFDWPISAGLKYCKTYKRSFEWAKHLNNCHPNIENVSFQHLCQIRYQTKIYEERMNSLSIFNEEKGNFFSVFLSCDSDRNLVSQKNCSLWWKSFKPKNKLKKFSKNFEIKNDKIHCTDASALQALIPYVKRLLQVYPEIKEFKTWFINVKQVVVSNKWNKTKLILTLMLWVLVSI